jgi:vesicle-associated membrane protein 7
MVIQYAICVQDGETKGEYSLLDSEKTEKLRSTILEKIMPKLSNTDHRRTLTQKDLEFHMKRSGNITVFSVSNVDTSKRLVWGMIDEAEAAVQQGTFKSKTLRELVLKFNDPKNDKIAVLNEKIDDVKQQMIDNIDKVIERGQKLDELAQQTDEIQDSAMRFKKTARKVKNSYLARFVFLIILLIFIIFGIAVIALLAGCQFFQNPGVCGVSNIPPYNNITAIAFASKTTSNIDDTKAVEVGLYKTENHGLETLSLAKPSFFLVKVATEEDNERRSQPTTAEEILQPLNILSNPKVNANSKKKKKNHRSQQFFSKKP